MILVWIPANCYFLLLPLWHDLESSAMLKVIMILLNPMLQTITALTILLIPTFVKRPENSGTAALDHIVQVMFKIFLAGGIGYWVVLSLVRSPLIDLLYGADYAQVADLLVVAGFLPLATAVIAVFGGALRAMKRPDQVFRGYIASTLVTLTVGFALVYAYGVDGAVLGIINASAVTAFSIYRLYKQVLSTAMERDVQ